MNKRICRGNTIKYVLVVLIALSVFLIMSLTYILSDASLQVLAQEAESYECVNEYINEVNANEAIVGSESKTVADSTPVDVDTLKNAPTFNSILSSDCEAVTENEAVVGEVADYNTIHSLGSEALNCLSESDSMPTSMQETDPTLYPTTNLTLTLTSYSTTDARSATPSHSTSNLTPDAVVMPPANNGGTSSKPNWECTSVQRRTLGRSSADTMDYVYIPEAAKPLACTSLVYIPKIENPLGVFPVPVDELVDIPESRTPLAAPQTINKLSLPWATLILSVAGVLVIGTLLAFEVAKGKKARGNIHKAIYQQKLF